MAKNKPLPNPDRPSSPFLFFRSLMSSLYPQNFPPSCLATYHVRILRVILD